MADGLRVGVNLLWCVPGAVGGSEEYLARQLDGLADVAPEIDATLFVVPGYAAAHPDVAARHPLVVADVDARRRSRRIVAETTWLPPRLAGVDVVHHGGGTVPPRSPGPVLLTIHDVQYRTYPKYQTRLKRQYLRLAVPRAVHEADVIAVPTRVRPLDGARRLPHRRLTGSSSCRTASTDRSTSRRRRSCASATTSATGPTSSTRR